MAFCHPAHEHVRQLQELYAAITFDVSLALRGRELI
jgi:hypothetical protein